MTDEIHKTIICSIISWDIIGYSKKPDAEQLALKNQFNDLINDALVNTVDDDRIILDTGDGAAIAYMGSPEDAVFIAVKIRERIIETIADSLLPLELRVGINLGPVKIVDDINGIPNIIGDGINVAHSIMNFAKVNEILVTRSYYEVTCRLTKELSAMFNHSVVLFDEQGREHEVYSLWFSTNYTDAENQPLNKRIKSTTVKKFPIISNFNRKHGLTSLIMLAVLFTSVKLIFAPHSYKVNLINSVSAESIPVSETRPISYELDKTNFTRKNPVLANATENFKSMNEGISYEKSEMDNSVEVKKTSHKEKKKVSNKMTQTYQMQTTEAQFISTTDKANTEYIETKKDKHSANVAFLMPEDNQTQVKLNWKTLTDSMKLGHKNGCTQSEIAIGQCH